MKKKTQITQSAFKVMLNWLDTDSGIAAEKYEAIRRRLIKILHYRGCYDAEDLADETIDRVIKKIEKLSENYEGNPENYFFGVLNNVYREYLRKPVLQELPYQFSQKEMEVDDDPFRDHYQCLQKCLQTLSAEKRSFILNYYRGEKAAKIENRKQLAKIQGVDLGGLRVQAFRLREKLQKCVSACIKNNN